MVNYHYFFIFIIFFIYFFYHYFFYICYLAAPRPTLDHYRGGSLTHPLLINCILHIQPEVHWEPCNEVSSINPVRHLVGFEPGNLQFSSQHLNPLGHSPQRKTKKLNLRKWQKILALDPILAHLAQIRVINFFFFFKNMALSVTRCHGQLSSCRTSVKTNDPILRKLSDGRTEGGVQDRQMDKSNFIKRCPTNVQCPKIEI